jgi:CheY-like chemotaxis protein
LINDILDFSKLEAGKIEIENLDFDLFEHIDDTVKSMVFKAEEKKLTIENNIAANVPRVIKGDPTRLRQVLLNLISNAIKFTEQGGVTINISLVEALANHQCILRFEVCDSGLGISEEGLQRLFKSFSQVDASTTRNYGGTGLGLVISKSLVEMMDGKIGVESELNLGSKFYFTIQVGMSSLEVLRRNMPKPICIDEVKTPRLRILLAEDNLVNQKVASIHLENLGHCVHLASNGMEAFEDFKNKDYDLIFMDIQMPEADGFQSTALIREYEKQTSKPSKIPIIAMTANAMKGDKEQCITAGMDDYISKPFTAVAIQAILRKYTQTNV